MRRLGKNCEGEEEEVIYFLLHVAPQRISIYLSLLFFSFKKRFPGDVSTSWFFLSHLAFIQSLRRCWKTYNVPFYPKLSPDVGPVERSAFVLPVIISSPSSIPIPHVLFWLFFSFCHLLLSNYRDQSTNFCSAQVSFCFSFS